MSLLALTKTMCLREISYLYKRYPTQQPAKRPTTVGRGMDLAEAEKDTPATKTTASIPSRRTVTNGRTNMAYFSINCLNHPLSPVLMGDSRAFANLTRHLD